MPYSSLPLPRSTRYCPPSFHAAKYDFSRIGVEDTVAHLAYVASKEGITAEPEALNVIALKADGGMRDALSIFDQVVSFTGGHHL